MQELGVLGELIKGNLRLPAKMIAVCPSLFTMICSS
jgi:hypothetical protein